MRGLFVTGTGTGVGKTILSAALLATMNAAGEQVRAYKPVLTGLDESAGTWPPDHELLAAAAGMDPAQVAPLRFGPAVSPHLAAALSGLAIEPKELVDLARTHLTAARSHESPSPRANQAPILLVEGIGGLLVPLNDGYTVLDLAVDLGLPLLIAAHSGLGTINHTLLTLRAARSAGLDVRAVVLTPWPRQPSQLEASNRETIQRLGEVEVNVLAEMVVPRVADLASAGARLPWRRWLERSSAPAT